MRGLWVTEYTEFNNLTIENIPPAKLETAQVRIKVKAAGVSFANNLVVSGKYQRKPPLPFTPGTECSGEIIECGSNVTRFKPGDRVFSVLDWGGHAEEVVAWEVNTYPISDKLTFAQATNFNSYATSLAALTWNHLLNLQPGQTILVHGAAGAIGLATIDLGKIFEDSLRCLRVEGRICPIGFTSGQPAKIPSNILLVKNITVCGLNMGTYYGWSPTDIRYEMEHRIRPLMNKINKWAENKNINMKVCDTFPLSNFKEAMSLVTSRKSIGRVVLLMD